MYTSFNARALGLQLSGPDTLRLAAEHGFGGVDLMVRDLVDQGEDLLTMKRRMDDLGLKAGAFPFPFDWRGEESRFQDDLQRLPAIAEAASSLGATRTGTWVMPETPDPAASARERCFALHVSRLHRVAKVLGSFGIRLGLEVIGVATWRTGRGETFIARLDALEPLRAEIEHASGQPIGIVADSWHLYAAGEPVSHATRFGVDRIVWTHVADLPAGASPDRSAMVDSVRGLPGEHGTVDSRGLLQALQDLGYDGPVMAEPLKGSRTLRGLSSEATAREAARSLRSVWPAARAPDRSLSR